MKEVKRKILGIAVVLLAIAMLAAPVMAMKGQTKQDFKLVIQELPGAGEVKEADGNLVWRDRSVDIYEACELYLQIGPGGATEDLAKAYLEYEGSMNYVAHYDSEGVLSFLTVRVAETVSIYDSDVTHDESTLRGTLVITANGDNRGGHGANFVGFGTGEFEGVKISGKSEPLTLVFTNPDPPGYFLQLTRVGTVMGWP